MNKVAIIMILAVCTFGYVNAQSNDSSSIRNSAHKAVVKSPEQIAPAPPTASVAKTAQQDIAFMSVRGSRIHNIPSGFQRAVIYNAQGAVVKEIDISRSDSIYSLDKMIQENSKRGPIFVRFRK